jgi:hypothetical protein
LGGAQSRGTGAQDKQVRVCLRHENVHVISVGTSCGAVNRPRRPGKTA